MGASLYSSPIGVMVLLGGGMLLLLLLLKTMGGLIAPLLFTYTLAITVIPLIQAFERKGLRRGPAVALVFGGAFLLAVVILAIAINLIMDNLVTPRLTGKSLSLRTSVLAIAAMVWLWVFGALGAILSVSLMLFLRMVLASSPKTLPLAYLISTEDYVPPDQEG